MRRDNSIEASFWKGAKASGPALHDAKDEAEVWRDSLIMDSLGIEDRASEAHRSTVYLSESAPQNPNSYIDLF